MPQNLSKRKFEKFYNKHIDKVYRYVFFRSRDKETAEDLVSEIFIKALNKFYTYDKNISSSAWIMTITKNHLANYWRDKKETISLDVEYSANDEQPIQQSDKILLKRSQYFFRKKQDTEDLHELLGKLNKEDKEIVTLHYLCGYKYSEIAEMKDIKLSAVKVASWRAIKKLKDVIVLIVCIILSNFQNL